MQKLIGFILAMILVSPLWGVAKTTTQAGNYNVGATWVGGVAPVDGDTLQIDHDVHVTATTTIGKNAPSPGAGDPTPAIFINTGTLTVDAGVSLTVRGDIKHYTTITMGAGSTLAFDPTLAADPTTAAYKVTTGGADLKNDKLVCSGTSGSHVTIKTNRPGGTEARAAWLDEASFMVHQVDCTYGDFIDLGGAGYEMWGFRGGASFQSPSVFRWTNCTFTRCGKIVGFTRDHSSNVFDMHGVHFYSSLGTNNLQFSNGIGSAAVLYNSSFDKLIGNVLDGMIIQYVLLRGSMEYIAPGTFDNVVLYKTDNTSLSLNGPSYTNVYYLVGTPGGPSSGQGLNLSSATVNQTIDGMVSQLVRDSVTDYETLVSGGGNGALTKTVKNTIVLPSSNTTTGLPTNYTSGVLFVGVAGAAAKMEYYHNTVHGGNGDITLSPMWLQHPGVVMSANMVTAYKSNLYYDIAAAASNHASYNDAIVNDVMTPAAVTHNAAWNWTASVEAGSAGTAYSYPTTSAPGANDMNSINPRFYAPTRNFEDWSVSMGQARTVAAGLNLLEANPLVNIPKVLAYVRKGWSPTNLRYKNRGHDSLDIGGVPMKVWNQPGWGPGAAF